MQLTAEDISDALAQCLVRAPILCAAGSERVFTGISTDSRTLQSGELFVALISPKSDGHDYLAQAFAAGAAGMVISRDIDAPGSLPCWRVSDTEIAYGHLARWWAKKFTAPRIGVTGSVGKTTVKEMIAAALSPLGPILKTPASQNNETGVPKTLLQMNSAHQAVVIEMGMRGAGQIKYLCEIAKPTIGVVTRISENHLELLGSQKAIADAKGELLESLPENGLAILNADDPFFEYLQAKARCEVLSYGAESEASLIANEIVRGEAGWDFRVSGVPVHIPSPARHDVGNALAALAVAQALGVPLTEAAAQLSLYTSEPMRMEIMKTNWGGTILNDAYNAAPASVRSALETLTALGEGRKIAFLGDMRELGDASPAAHLALGETIDALGGLDALYTVGALAAQIPGATAYFPSSLEASRFSSAEMEVRPTDFILVKGSRAMAMEQIVSGLIGRGGNDA
jgi:UDP-N-acetylmuramoyl-tripeptide--D-alanyl-D-alanine ligase